MYDLCTALWANFWKALHKSSDYYNNGNEVEQQNNEQVQCKSNYTDQETQITYQNRQISDLQTERVIIFCLQRELELRMQSPEEVFQ